jgi:hypothetical protein
MAGLTGAALFLWGSTVIVPYIISAVTNMIHLGVVITIALAMFFVATSPEIHNEISRVWRLMTRKLTYAIITYDPIGDAETTLERQQKGLDEIIAARNNVAGQLKGLDQRIKKNADKIEADLQQAQLAEKQGDMRSRGLMSEEAQALGISNKNITATRNKIAEVFSKLNRIVDATDYSIKKNRSTLQIQKDEIQAILPANAAMNKAWSIIGDGAEKQRFELAIQTITDKANREMAEIDSLMDLSQPMITGSELEKGVNQQNALKALEDWEKKSTLLISSARDVTPQPNIIPDGKQGRFADLLKQ